MVSLDSDMVEHVGASLVFACPQASTLGNKSLRLGGEIGTLFSHWVLGSDL